MKDDAGSVYHATEAVLVAILKELEEKAVEFYKQSTDAMARAEKLPYNQERLFLDQDGTTYAAKANGMMEAAVLIRKKLNGFAKWYVKYLQEKVDELEKK